MALDRITAVETGACFRTKGDNLIILESFVDPEKIIHRCFAASA
jgi:hypothetical protein